MEAFVQPMVAQTRSRRASGQFLEEWVHHLSSAWCMPASAGGQAAYPSLEGVADLYSLEVEDTAAALGGQQEDRMARLLTGQSVRLAARRGNREAQVCVRHHGGGGLWLDERVRAVRLGEGSRREGPGQPL